MKGSVRKRGSTYTITYDEPPGPDGKRRQRSKGGFRTRKLAEAAQAKIIHELQTGAYVEPSRMTVREFGERWLRDYCRPNVNANTLEDYQNNLRRYVNPHLGACDLERVRTLDILDLYTTLRERGGRGGRELSPATVRIVHRMLHRMFGHAVQWQVIARNPVAHAQTPKVVEEDQPILETTEAVDAILDAARGTWLFMPVLLGVGLGLRRGEVLALRWSNLDLAEKTLTVSRQIRQTQSAGWEFAAPKTASGSRVLPLPAFLADELRGCRFRRAAYLLGEGMAWDETALLSCRPDGSPFMPDGLSHAFARIADQAGYPEVTFHGLRHTCLTFLIEKGIPMNVVCKIAGHASPEVTMRVYAKVLRRMTWAAADTLDGLFEGSRRSTVREL